ncbi:MAG: penicillin-binding transpeptidase domain-containing protein [Anaerolineales bacterium]|jgi:penicillin-binding protein 2
MGRIQSISLKRIFLAIAVIAAAALTGCGVPRLPSLLAGPTLPPPVIHTEVAPDPEPVARAFLQAWKQGNYTTMYGLLTQLSRDAMSKDDFTKRYQDVTDTVALSGLGYQILSSVKNPDTAEVTYQVTLDSAIVGNIARQTTMMLKYENGAWRVAWDDSDILPELKGGNQLVMDLQSPARANIYDRNGKALAYEAQAVSLGVIPGQITDEKTLLGDLSEVLGMNPEVIRSEYANAGSNWYVPLGDVSMDEIKSMYNYLSGLGGLVIRTSQTRYYYGGGVASDVVGYVNDIPKEDLQAYLAKGYSQGAKVGIMGLEKWAEPYLAGQQGGTLYVVSPSGQVLDTLAHSDPKPSDDVYTTLDRDLQTQIERTGMGSFSGAVVVLNRDTGEVLAMVSSPSFDSNLFDPTNYNSQFALSSLLSDPRNPLLNRATQGTYPLGSVFKVITMSAALQSGAFTVNSTYHDTGYFTELPGITLDGWTVSWGDPPLGTVNLIQGIIESSDPFFWHIGLTLFNRDPWLVSNMARGFGLGKPTGIGAVAEAAGLIPDPAWKLQTMKEAWTAGDAVNSAIGQGYTLVTPLQVANFMAAVGNGGTLLRPQIIESIRPPIGNPVFTFSPQVNGKLPISADTLAALQEGLRGVVSDPKGTAQFDFLAWQNELAGKTGTAETPAGNGNPDAWFAGYTYLNRPDKPDIAMAVIAENGGEGSLVAGPIFRRVLEIYFDGKPETRYPWESEIGLTATPSNTPTITSTPTPTKTPKPR